MKSWGIKTLLSMVFLLTIIASFSIDIVGKIGTDYGVYFSNGWFINQDLIIYKDFWTHKTPLLPLILSLWISVFGSGVFSAISYVWFLYISSIIFIFIIGQYLGIPYIARVSSTLILTIFVIFHLLDPSRNGVILFQASLFEFGAFVCTYYGLTKKNYMFFILAGGLIALGFFTRQTIILSLFWIIMLILFSLRNQERPKTFLALISLIMGTFPIFFLFFIYFKLNSIQYKDLMDQVFFFNMIYTQGYQKTISDWLIGWMNIILAQGLLSVLIILCSYVFRIVRNALFMNNPPTILEFGLITWLLVDMIALIFTPKVISHYLLGIIIPTSLIIGIEFHKIMSIISKSSKHAIRYVILIALIVSFNKPLIEEMNLIYSSVTQVFSIGPVNIINQRSDLLLANKVLQLAPQDDDQILLFAATGAEIYPFSRKLPAIKYDNLARLIYILTPNDYDDWLVQVEKNPPKVIVCVYHPDLEAQIPPPGNGRDFTNVVKMYRYIRNNFTLIETTEYGVELYISTHETKGY